jgi:hypothetical protein
VRTEHTAVIEEEAGLEALRCVIAVQTGLTDLNASVPEDMRTHFHVGPFTSATWCGNVTAISWETASI